MSSSPLNFQLAHYEGPLDLLLDLIRKQQINIYDIPIAQITQQYLDYVQKAMALDIELSAEFVYMAATLIHIKSKMLLPQRSRAGEDRPGGRSAQRTGGPAAGARAVPVRRGDAAGEADDRGSDLDAIRRSTSLSATTRSPDLQVTLFDLVKTLRRCWSAPRTGRCTR